MRIAIYVRVSTQRQVQSQSIEQQLERLCAYCQTQNWDLLDENIFRDDGFSGSTLRRPGLDRLRDRAAVAAFDRLLITSPDRLARKYVHQVLLIEELERKGAQVEFLDRPMSQDPHDQLVLQIRGAVAEYERTLIVERMRRGRLMKYRSGTLLPWTRPPYGYRLHPERPRDPAGVRIDPAEAAIVAELFATYLQPGVCTRKGSLRQQVSRAGDSPPCAASCATHPIPVKSMPDARARVLPRSAAPPPIRLVSPMRHPSCSHLKNGSLWPRSRPL